MPNANRPGSVSGLFWVNLETITMKKISYLLLFCCFLAACTKDYPDMSLKYKVATPASAVIGNWEWYRTWGYFIGTVTPQSTGKTWQLTLNLDSTFSQSGNYTGAGIPDPTGTFSLGTGTYIPALGYGDYIFLKSSNMPGRPFKYSLHSKDTLYLDMGSAFDLPLFYFVRKK